MCFLCGLTVCGMGSCGCNPPCFPQSLIGAFRVVPVAHESNAGIGQVGLPSQDFLQLPFFLSCPSNLQYGFQSNDMVSEWVYLSRGGFVITFCLIALGQKRKCCIQSKCMAALHLLFGIIILTCELIPFSKMCFDLVDKLCLEFQTLKEPPLCVDWKQYYTERCWV